jgi:hypothetical protein
LFQTILSRNVPTLNSPGDWGYIWSVISSKMFETRYFSSSGNITRLDPGDETSAPIIDMSNRK